jgi:hypothetical protein
VVDTIDIHSPTWRAVKAWADKRASTSRTQVETPNLSLPETECARGALRELRLLLELPNQKPLNTTHSGNAE